MLRDRSEVIFKTGIKLREAMEIDSLDKFKSDHLILLIGGNPLPNFVAAQLLASPKATIWLLHSGGGHDAVGTKNIAENLEILLRQKNENWSIHLEPIPSTNNVGIKNRIRDIFKANQIKGRVGLHYTGGTKSMALHTYRELENQFANSQLRPVFSYLDPRKLALRIDGYDTEPSQLIHILQIENLRKLVEIQHLDQLASLHDYVPARPNQENWGTSEEIHTLAEAFVKVHIGKKRIADWIKLRQQWRKTPKGQDFHLPDRNNYPNLLPIIEAFDNLCGGRGLATPALVAKHLLPEKNDPTLRSCSKWLLGGWLELYTERAFFNIQSNPPLSFKGTNLFYQNKRHLSDKFELDIAGIVGYQLFAISCIATTNKAAAKEHLLEAFVRAKQLGGDEARVGLVCLTEEKETLEKEIKSSWDIQGKSKVFGISDLKELPQHFTDWLQQQTNL